MRLKTCWLIKSVETEDYELKSEKRNKNQNTLCNFPTYTFFKTGPKTRVLIEST